MVHIVQRDDDDHHVHGGDTVELSHALCIEDGSEEQLQKDFDSANPATVAWNIAGTERRHEICHQTHSNNKTAFKRKKFPKPCQLSLTHLRSCRQIYFEANTVHCTNNTFAFFRNDILERFARARFQKKQHLAIRSLYLDVSIIHTLNVDVWSASISKAVRRFQSVRCLYLNLMQLYCMCTAEICGYEGSEMMDRQAKMFKRLGKLPLKKATLIIDDSDIAEQWDTDAMGKRWTMREKQDFSKKVREALLA